MSERGPDIIVILMMLQMEFPGDMSDDEMEEDWMDTRWAAPDAADIITVAPETHHNREKGMMHVNGWLVPVSLLEALC